MPINILFSMSSQGRSFWTVDLSHKQLIHEQLFFTARVAEIPRRI